MPKVSEAHLERRRQQILNAAMACFARKGFHQTTMADIAAEAGVSDTLAYRYFSGKEELVEAAVRQHGDAIADDLLGAPDGVEDFSTLVDLLIGTNLRRFEQPEEMKSTMGIPAATPHGCDRGIASSSDQTPGHCRADPARPGLARPSARIYEQRRQQHALALSRKDAIAVETSGRDACALG